MTSHKQHETSMENTMSHHSPLPIFMHLTHFVVVFIYLQQTVKCFMKFTNYSLLSYVLFLVCSLDFEFEFEAPSYTHTHTYYILVYFAVEQNINL